jgi:hypothetical protein
MSILGQNVLTETVEYLDAGSIFDAVVTRKIAALNTSTESNIDLFIGATGNLNFNIKGYNAFRFQQKSDTDKTTQMNLINNQGLEFIAGDNSRTTVISDIKYTQSVTKHNIKSTKGIVSFDDDIEITGSLTTGNDFLAGGSIIGSSTNMLRTFSNGQTVGFGFRVANNSNLELYKFDDHTNTTKTVLYLGHGDITGIQDTLGFPVYGSNPSVVNNGLANILSQKDSYWTSNGTDIYYLGGRIGVGTSIPLYTGHFNGTVFASGGFNDGITTIQNGQISCSNVVSSRISCTDGSGIQNMTAANVTVGKLQTAVMPNIIDTNEVRADVTRTVDIRVSSNIYFEGNIYRNNVLFGGDSGNASSLFGYYSSNNSIYYNAGGIGIGLSNPMLSLHISATDAIKVPVGTSLQRPNSNIGSGMLRYNTTTKQFEGYSGNNWAGLGGVIDVNQDTYVSAEDTPGANNDQLKFFTSNIQRMYIGKSGNIGIGTTSAKVILDINGSDAIRIPIGTSSQRPATSNLGTGMLRYNTTTSQFEGYASSNWAGLGGVIDVNQDTYISAENTPGINNDQLKFFTSNNLIMTIDKTGNVGIGTSIPANKFQVVGDCQISTNLTVSGITSSTSIGIGTTTPLVSLHINTTDAINLPVGTNAQRPTPATGMLRYNTTTSQFEGYGGTAWSGLGGVIDVAQTTYISAENYPGAANNELKFITLGNQRMIIGSTGNVGIGSTTPLVSLDINTNDALKIPNGTSLQRPSPTSGMLRYNTTTSQFEGYGASAWASLTGVIDLNQDTYISAETTPGLNNDQLKFYTFGSQRMLIDSNGDVNIASNLSIGFIKSHIIPSSNATYDLGSPSNQFRDLYLSGHSLYIGNTIIERDDLSGNITFKDKLNPSINRSVIVDQIQLVSSVDSTKHVTLNVNNNGDLNILNNSTGATTGSFKSLNSNLFYNDGFVTVGTSNNTNNYSFIAANNTNSSNQQRFQVCNGSNYLNIMDKTYGSKLIVDILGHTNTIGEFTVKPESQSYNFTTSNSDSTIIMNLTANFANFSNLTLPSIYPITKFSSNIFFANSNIMIDFKANNSTSAIKIAPSVNSINSITTYNSNTNRYLTTSINSNNYFAFIGNNLNYDINFISNIGNAKLGIGTSNYLQNSLEVNGDTNLTGNLSLTGNIYQNNQLFSSSVFTKTNSNIYYNGHTIVSSSNYSTSNNSSGAPTVTVMGITNAFLNLSTLSLPSNLPVRLENPYVIQALQNISINLSADTDGSTVYVGTGPSNAPLYQYVAGTNSNQAINLNAGQYLSVLGY